ncbi:uncharacterized protein LOC132202849 [Neocloeon triangulifer]|uniref:uncharacterized protein LOC132202849 n=1 Tax=Neocloeon triangulifer TaxID=2078957 RepID=UPI00286EE20E|nr:uncharacterized protein LOC132202849 [Neocloeon triangulifer]
MIGALQVLFSKLKGLVLWILAIFRRACCCFRRRRRLSESQPLTDIGIIPNNPQDNVEGGWDSWGKEEDKITQQIREYRNSLAMARQNQDQPEEPEERVDYFQDMVPRVTKAPRVALSTHEEQVNVSNTSELFAAQPLPIAGGDLGSWAEDEGWVAEEGNWEEDVREQKRMQRERRAYELQMKRAEHRSLGARLS